MNGSDFAIERKKSILFLGKSLRQAVLVEKQINRRAKTSVVKCWKRHVFLLHRCICLFTCGRKTRMAMLLIQDLIPCKEIKMKCPAQHSNSRILNHGAS